MEEKTLRCPNCGANAVNHNNCEYCGSLLVRFVDKGIDLSKTSYLSSTEVFSGLIKELEQNLAMQEQGDESTTTDILRPEGKVDHIGAEICVLRTGKCVWQDGQDILLSKANKGLVISLDFNTYVDTSDSDSVKFNKEQERQHTLFKQLPSYALFTPHNSFYKGEDGEQRRGIEYAIDFGEDAEGAARLISELLIKVYGVPLNENLEFYTNYGIEKTNESRAMIAKARGWDNQSYPTWMYWVGGLILFALFKMCA